MHAHKSNPLALAKIMTSWVWNSLLPRDHGPAPKNVYDVPKALTGECGWRDYFLETIFAEIGVEHRRANFGKVPFQTGHTATELFINGKWMFFDATYGTYFTKKGSDIPLSIEEARNNWPNVDIKQSDLPGWTGKFTDLKTISPSAYSTVHDSIAQVPFSIYDYEGIVCGEYNSLYFGPISTYYVDGKSPKVPTPDRSWKVKYDTHKASNWSKLVNFYDGNKKLYAQHVLYDNKTQRFVELSRDKDEAAAKKTSFVTEKNILEYEVIRNKDGTLRTIEYDKALYEKWSSRDTFYYKNLDHQFIKNDDGSSWYFEADDLNQQSWTSYQDTYDPTGTTVKTSIAYDDGTLIDIDWQSGTPIPSKERSDLVLGTSNNDQLAGSDSNDIIIGHSGNDLMYGSAGQDFMLGGAGSDTLNGGLGGDIFFGGKGADTFVWDGIADIDIWRNSTDIIKDFSRKEGDLIDLHLLDASTVRSGNQAFTFIGAENFSAPGQIRYIHKGNDTYLLLNTDKDSSPEGVIVLSGIMDPKASWFSL
ncbi:calcium-binding protein [Microvirga rosea]|uniref:calcium-binding protein n=1 Tax=Microvirga rosea TaxID=2715425 RepID=UPI001D0A040A|nr:calcium-binding protein [Microvirga rosea]MCB8822637.1 calcium-binding protein [Microvirga rosea]